ncbi:MAG TPA: anti-sigma factor [Saprospiraceae bacterium]|nr:anti-sigma factor [Saprospiraceae bacterium]
MTKKEIIENGWVEKYVLGLTTEAESSEVERLANLYPDIQENINETRNKICGKFNRNLTQPALRDTFMNKRKMKILAIAGVALFSLGFCFLCREYFALKKDYSELSRKLEVEEAAVIELASFAHSDDEQSQFLHAPNTKKIKLKGSESFPEAEAMVFKCGKTGKMLLRIVDLPELPEGQAYEVWAGQKTGPDRLIGLLKPPLRYDSLYALDSVLYSSALQIRSMDNPEHKSLPVCMVSISN